MNQKNRIDWIFFDLDDTLWNFSQNSADSLKILYSISPILKKLFNSIEEFIEIYHRNNARMWDLYSKGQVTTSQLKVERWRRTLATRQFEVLTAVCEELERNYLEILAKGTKMIPGISEMLKRLVKSNLIAVLSNGFEKTQYLKLRNSGLSKFITRTIVSEEIGINKPDQRLFNYAIEETGARPPFLMIGDNPDSDILGAMKAGWHAIWYNPKQIPFPYSDAELESLDINPSLLFAVVNDIEGMEKEIRRFHHEMPN